MWIQQTTVLCVGVEVKCVSKTITEWGGHSTCEFCKWKEFQQPIFSLGCSGVPFLGYVATDEGLSGNRTDGRQSPWGKSGTTWVRVAVHRAQNQTRILCRSVKDVSWYSVWLCNHYIVVDEVTELWKIQRCRKRNSCRSVLFQPSKSIPYHQNLFPSG
jgi:hypothetical protein